MSTCRLCFHVVGSKTSIDQTIYEYCEHCVSWQMNENALPKLADEQTRYATHNNKWNDQGYRDYLMKFGATIVAQEQKGAKGVDVGAGIEKVLTRLLNEEELDVKAQDPLYGFNAYDEDELYNFVVSIETVEHFHHPYSEWERMNNAILRNGRMYVATNLLEGTQKFEDWWYVKDPTHVFFYSKITMRYIADIFNMQVDFYKHLTVFTKQ